MTLDNYLDLRMQASELMDRIDNLERRPTQLNKALRDFEAACMEDGLAASMVYGGIGHEGIETLELCKEVCKYSVPPAVEDAFYRLQGAFLDSQEQR